MTSGTKTVDNRTNFSTAHGSSKIGYYSKKTWSGTDSAKRSVYGKGPFKYYYDLMGQKRFWNPNRPPKRVGLGEHPYSASGTHRYDGWGSYKSSTSSYSVYFDLNENWPPSWNGIPTWSSNDDLTLVNKLRTRILGSEFDLGVFLAEGHEALETIADAARRLRIAQHALRRGRPYDCWLALVQGSWRQPRPPAHIRHEVLTSRQITDAWLSRNWLQMQYGWLPLVSDIHDGAEFLAHQLNVPAAVQYRAARALRGKYPQPGPPKAYHRDGKYLRGKVIKAIVKEVNIPLLSGLVNPTTILWETLPYSFVCDWAYPIGAWLQARGVANSVTGTFVTSAYDHLYTYNAHPSPYADAYYPSFDSSDNIYESWSTSRTVSSNLAVPLPSVKPLDKVLTWKHAANAVALLVTSGIGRRVLL